MGCPNSLLVYDDLGVEERERVVTVANHVRSRVRSNIGVSSHAI